MWQRLSTLFNVAVCLLRVSESSFDRMSIYRKSGSTVEGQFAEISVCSKKKYVMNQKEISFDVNKLIV